MAETIYGSVCYKDKWYPFFLEGRRTVIVGEAWKYYDDFLGADEEETVSGITSNNRRIVFLRCKFRRSSLQQKVWFSSIGYILSRGDSGVSNDLPFEKLSFYSDAINAFFPPQKAMKTDLDPRNWDGSMTIELRPFAETGISFGYNNCECKLNVSRNVITKMGKSNIGNINSAFSFVFDTVQPSKELPQYWLALYDFLSFVNYGTDISFDKITLNRRCGDGLFAYCADAYIFSDREYTPRPDSNALTVDDIPLDRLGNAFSKISSLRGSDNRLNYYFPENYKEGFQIDANRWLVTAMTFEGLFTSCYPGFKQNAKKAFQIAKSAALSALDAVDKNAMNKNEREYFEDCREQIERYEGRLEEMLNYVVKKYKSALDDILEFNIQEYRVSVNAYGNIYGKYRNKIAHGEITPMGDNEKAVYRVLQAVIYCMLLEGTGLDDNTLRAITKKLFL